MPMNRIQRVAATIAAAGAIAAASTGITYAATSNATVYGCANVHGALRLLSSSGKCPAGYHKVAISLHPAPGKRGAAGAKGAAGAAGATGVRGTSAIALLNRTTTATQSVVTRKLPNVGLIAYSVCNADNAEIVLFDDNGIGDYDVQGRSLIALGGSGKALLTANSQTQPLPAGPSTVFYRQAAGGGSAIYIKAGQLADHLLLTRNGTSVSLDLFLLSAADHCLANLQATPSD